MDLTSDGLNIFKERYADKNDQGEVIETPDMAVERLSRAAARAEELYPGQAAEFWEKEFARVLDNRWFVPSTPIWANMGKTDRANQPGACFVLDVQDDLHDMYQTLLDSAMVTKSGGGIGYNFSRIRPQGELVKSTKGKASGAVELIRLYDASAAMIKQGGVRRGAFMGILNCDHPEIEDFIRCKLSGEITNFNLSVGVTHEFMNQVESDELWELKFNGEVRRTIAARELWEKIVRSAWACGDPGLIFLDRIQESNPIPGRPMNCTNPCGEQPLSPGESCLLGSINLALMKEQDGGEVAWARLKETARIAVRFLDNMIDVGEYPLDFIAENTRASRKIGLGVLGLHDLLIQMKLSYDSPEGIELASKVMAFIKEEVHKASADLGVEKGNFPLWDESVYAVRNEPHRNASCLTIAPTGTITLLAGVEGYGIEPIFAIAYKKTYLRDGVPEKINVFSPLFLKACYERGTDEKALEEVAARGSCQGVKGIPDDIQRLFRGAQEIDPMDHLAMQVALQQEVDNAISKTINLPAMADLDMVEKIYFEAWKRGLKGITVFREGSKQGVIEIGDAPKTSKDPAYIPRGYIHSRPQWTSGITERIDTGCGKMYLTVNRDPNTDEVIETFITTGSDGGCLIFTEAASRLTSMAIRAGVSLQDIIEQLKSTHTCPSWARARSTGKPLSAGKSCPSAIANALEKYVDHKEDGKSTSAQIRGICPECMQPSFVPLEGCYTCLGCGYSKC
ncbi:MAG: adenosylcobalamin-dependent ribonucleoside-diphosphate reductase [Syntrophomonadaceae bacterium]